MSNVDVSGALYAVEAAIAARAATLGIPPPETIRPPYGAHNWPPDYGRVYAWRRQQEALFAKDPDLQESARAWYAGDDLMRSGCADPALWAERCAGFINHWCDTYDPRNSGKPGKVARMPFVMFQRQEELVHFVLACMLGDASGLVEKSRDMGATWCCLSISNWLWLFWSGVAVGWGANKLELVDVLGDPDTILEKLRSQIRLLADWVRPPVVDGEHLKHTVCRNPINGSVVSGQGGKNIGRGGRRRIYFVDEAAHIESPISIEASLSENTRCRIDISSVSQPGTVYHRKRLAGVEYKPGQPVAQEAVNVFVMDWSDHPEKTKEWYAGRRRYYEVQGTPEVTAREIDRDYMGAATGIIIKYEHVQAAVDAHRLLGFDDDGGWWGGLDVADQGIDTNALVRGRGVVVKHAEEWGERDPGVTARRAFRVCRDTAPITLQYDCIGLGTNVKSEFNRLTVDDGVSVRWLTLVPWNAGAPVVRPGEPVIKGDRQSQSTNKTYFENFRAQAWWTVAQMFRRTWVLVEAHKHGTLEVDRSGAEAVYAATDEDGNVMRIGVNELISLDSSTIEAPVLTKLMREMSQAVWTQSSRLKNMVDKAPDGAKSPNFADALVMGRFPAPQQSAGLVGVFGPKVFQGGS